MKHFLPFLLILSINAFAQTQQLEEDIFMGSTKCKLVRTNVSTGEQKNLDTKNVSFGCKRINKTPLSLYCSLIGNDMIMATIEVSGDIKDNTATIQNENNSFNLSDIKQGFGDFKSESNLSILDENFTEKRVCTGFWAYNSIMEAWTEEESKKASPE